jgi:hypothetical protein
MPNLVALSIWSGAADESFLYSFNFENGFLRSIVFQVEAHGLWLEICGGYVNSSVSKVKTHGTIS